MAWCFVEPSLVRFCAGCGIVCTLGVYVARDPKTDPILHSLMLGFIWGSIPIVFYLWPVALFRVLTGYREAVGLIDENGPNFLFQMFVVFHLVSLKISCSVGLAVGAVIKITPKAFEKISQLLKRE